MGIRWKAAGSALLAILSAVGVFYCAASDPHSGRGFAILMVYFCIQLIFTPSTDEVEEEVNVGNYLANGINKTAAMAALIAFASPHPQFTGALLWLGVSFLFLSSAAIDLGHVCFWVAKKVKTYRDDKAQYRARILAEIAITNSLKVEEIQKAQDNQMEDDLLSDLSDFLNGTDANKA